MKQRPLRLKANHVLFACIAVILVFSLPSCKKVVMYYHYSKVKPSGPQPPWGPNIEPQMLAVIETLDSLNPVPLYTLTPQQARQKPTPADAVMQVMKDFNIPVPPFKADTTGMEIAVEGGSIHVRIYTPLTGKSSYPLIVYYHGGGWVIATVDTYNASAQALAEEVDAVVVSVEYRKAPEYKFPTAHNDAFAAYKWAVQNAAVLHADSNRIAVAGESAGGNLAVNVAIMARDNNIKMPLHILSVYPIANYDLNSPSYIEYADAKPLSKPLMQWFFSYYLNDPSQGTNPLISITDANLTGLPPVTIINAEIDPLESEGALLEEKLQSAGVPVLRQLFKGVTHEFFGMATVVPEAKHAQNISVQRLKEALY